MPRRVYTYHASFGWDALNLVSTVGAFLIADGVAVFLFDLFRRFRFASEDNAGKSGMPARWNGCRTATMPRAPFPPFAAASRSGISLASQVESGAWYLPNALTGMRETIMTSPFEGRPQAVLQMTGPGWPHLLAAVFTAAFFMALTVKSLMPAAICGVAAVASVIWWLWGTDPGPTRPPVDIGGGIRLPVYVTGPSSHSWWAMVVLLIVSGMTYGCLVLSYLFLWLVKPGQWPPPGLPVPALGWPLFANSLYLASSTLIAFTGRKLAGRLRTRAVPLLIAGALPPLLAANALDLWTQIGTGLRPDASAYGAAVFCIIGLQGFFVAVALIMALYTVARWWAGKLDGVRRVTFDNTMLFWHYTAGQGIFGVVLSYGFPYLPAGT